MEIFGGFMVMISIMGFFLAVIWLVMPFVVFAIKGKVDRTQEQVSAIESRLTAIEEQLATLNRNQKNCSAETKPEILERPEIEQ
jgi:uncharacterized membrane protein